MKELILTVGLPRSGKTTWAYAQGIPVLSIDSLRWTTYGRRYWPPGERRIWGTAWEMVRALFHGGHDHLIVDACHTVQHRRRFWIPSDSDDVQWNVVHHLVNTPVEECIRRATVEHDSTVIPVIRSMDSRFEPLGANEALYHGSQQGE